MRGIETPVTTVRRQVFEEVARIAFNSTSQSMNDDIEAVPYKIVNEDTELYRESIYQSREIVRERVRLAMGMSLRPEDRMVHLTAGIEESNISEKYYEPPLMQVIPSACNACEEKGYEVSDMCKGCVAHPCRQVCPVGAITMVKNKSYIDQSKCIKCGKCKSICPYDAISKKVRPCQKACGVGAIKSDKLGRAYIDNDKCVSCGQCMVSCPFGAISDKSQIFQLARALQQGEEIIAELGLTQVTDNDAILTFVKEVVQENPKAVEDFKNGKTNVVGWLMGQVMKKSGGKANPKTATELLKQILSEV